jgi:hypothetical protein
MAIYYSTILLLCIFSILEINYTLALPTRRVMLFIAYVLLVVQVGLRWESGTDWNSYLNHFKSISDFSSTSPLLNGFEYGYSIFVWLVKIVIPDYSFFLLLHAIIYYFLIFKSFQRYSPSLYLSLMLFYALSMGLMGSNRQLLALAICLFALRYIVDKKPVIFFLLILLAVNFHTSAFIFLVYYFLNRELKPFSVVLIIGVSFVIGKSQLPIAFFSFMGDLIGGNVSKRFFFYLEAAENVLSEYKLSVIGLLKRLIFLFLFYLSGKKLSKELPYYNVMLNGYIFGMAFYFLFSGTLLVMVSRGSIFFNVMEPLLIASQIRLLKITENKVVIIAMLVVFSVFFFFQSIATYPELFLPYKGVFINSDYSRILY